MRQHNPNIRSTTPGTLKIGSRRVNGVALHGRLGSSPLTHWQDG
jgi:hypothetical protein